jgi:hypothetical protein
MTIGQVLHSAAAVTEAGAFDASGAHVDRMVLELDDQGWEELSALLVQTLDAAGKVQERSNERRSSRAPGALRPSELAILHFATKPD